MSLLLKFFLRLLLINWILPYSSRSFLGHLSCHVWNLCCSLRSKRIVSGKHLSSLPWGNTRRLQWSDPRCASSVCLRWIRSFWNHNQGLIWFWEGPQNYFQWSFWQDLHSNSTWKHPADNTFLFIFVSGHPHSAFVDLVSAKPIEKPAGQQQVGTIWGSTLCQAGLHSTLWKLMSLRCVDYHIPFCTDMNNLTNNLSVGYMTVWGILYFFLSWISKCFWAQESVLSSCFLLNFTWYLLQWDLFLIPLIQTHVHGLPQISFLEVFKLIPLYF